MWFTKRSFENIIIQHAVHFRDLTKHSCLRDLRSETGLEYMLISSNKFVLFLVISCQICHQHLTKNYFRSVEV